MFGPVLKAYFEIFFITKYNTIVSIFLYVFIGIINYKKKFTIFNTILYWFFKPKQTPPN